MSAYSLGTIDVLWRRDLMRFWRQPTRIAGALGQPLIVWLVLGGGLSATFAIPGQRLDYLAYFFPGVMVMILLFASIFASVSIIEDRHQGFLQAILAGPGSRTALVVGKCLGASSVALMQAAMLVALAPLAGFSYRTIDWPLLAGTLVLSAVGLSALGFAVAWLIDNIQGYHAIQMTLLVPLWVVSGAMFPPAGGHPVFYALMVANPVAYAVAGVRAALHGGVAPVGTVIISSPRLVLAIVALFAAAALALAVFAASRLRSKRT
jgi:daunorubicin resistance ABC transporter membrane protein